MIKILFLIGLFSLTLQATSYINLHDSPDAYGIVGLKNQMIKAASKTNTYTFGLPDHQTHGITGDGGCASEGSWSRFKFFSPPGTGALFSFAVIPNSGFKSIARYEEGTMDHRSNERLSMETLQAGRSGIFGGTNASGVGIDDSVTQYFPNGAWIYVDVVEDSQANVRLASTYTLKIYDRAKFQAWLDNPSNFDGQNAKTTKGNTIHVLENDCVKGAITYDINVGTGASQQTCYTDADKDGFGAGVSFQSFCTADNESTNNTDCDDTNPSIKPTATETPGNLIDENCDAKILCYKDADKDGNSINATVLSTNAQCLQSEGEELLLDTQRDCDDNNANKFFGNTEIPNNGVDEDCSGADLKKCYVDTDKDGYGDASKSLLDLANGGCYKADGRSLQVGDTDDNDAKTYPGATEIIGDGKKQNSTASYGEICYKDVDNDGYLKAVAVAELPTINSNDSDCNDANEASKSFAENASNRTDCDDTKSNINPTATETAGNTVDENCNQKILCYVDEDEDGVSTADTQEISSTTCTLGGYTLLLGLNGVADNCPSDVNTAQLDSDGNGIGNICDRDFTSLHATNESTNGSVQSLYYEGSESTITLDENVNFSDSNDIKLERMYIPVTAETLEIMFENTSTGAAYVTIKSKFRAVSNYINLRYPKEFKTTQNVLAKTRSRDTEEIVVDNFKDLLSLDATVLASGRSIHYIFDKDTLSKMVPNGGWIYFVVTNDGSAPLHITYRAEMKVNSKLDRYKLDEWNKNINMADDAPSMLVYKTNNFGEGIVEEYIFENDYNTTGLLSDLGEENYTSIHDIATSDGKRKYEAHKDDAKSGYIKHTYHALIDQKYATDSANKFKVFIPEDFTDFSLFIVTKPIDGSLHVKTTYPNGEVVNYDMKNRMSIKFKDTIPENKGKWLKLDITHKDNENLGIMFEYKVKISSAN